MMDLIPGLVLFLGAIATIGLLGWDTFQNPKPITKAVMNKSQVTKAPKLEIKKRGFFNTGIFNRG